MRKPSVVGSVVVECVVIEWLERRTLFATVPSGFVDELYDNGLSGPTAMEFAPDGRLFVTQQSGALRVIDTSGNLLTTPFVTLTVDPTQERGLLGIAFDPSFQTKGFVYLYYTVPNGAAGSSGAFNRLSRFTAVDADPGAGYAPGDTAAAGELILLNLTPLSTADNHNGGAVHFGPDNKLYLAVGENANGNNAQSLNNFLGKILRLNVDGSAPADNPFNDADANPAEPRDYIWALGLRNPFTTAFDPVTGRFHINDVGENTWEEINEGIRGANYGWPTYEGPETDVNFGTPPIFAYRHDAPGTSGGNVISGGTFYRPAVNTVPGDYTGDYFFSDAGRGWIRRYDVATGNVVDFASSVSGPVDLKTGNDGALYYLERGSGSVRRVRANLPSTPAWLGAGSAATWNGSTLTVTGNATIVANPGADAPLIVGNTAAANLTINPSSGSQVNVGGVALSNGARATLSDAATDRVLIVNTGGLSITGTSWLDLTDNDMIVRGGNAAAVSALAKNGFAAGTWTGNGGLRSNNAATHPNDLTALGVASNATLGRTSFAGVTGLTPSDVLVKYTYYGDADLSGVTTLDDFTLFLNGYQTSGTTWLQGDFDYSGLVTLDDFTLFLAGYQRQGPPL
jgi:glucose/arabinose dehydrogenase